METCDRVARPLDFVVIGAAKSGTTSLFHHLKGHPGLYMPAAKEAPFFSKDEVYGAGWDAYLADHFPGAPPDVLWGTITPRYLGDLHVPGRMHQAMPDCRLVALLRNPVQRAFSKYRMLVRMDNEQRTFDALVEAELEPAVLARARSETLPLKHSVVVRGEYGRLLGTFLAHYRRDQLQVHLTDEFEKDPQAVLDAFLAFVGLEPGWTPANLGHKYFEGGDRQRFPVLTRVATGNRVLAAGWNRVPKDLRRSMLWWYRSEANIRRPRGNGAAEVAPALGEETRQRLIAFYRPDVAALEHMLGRPVPWAGLSSTT
jgi:hypothetical protein